MDHILSNTKNAFRYSLIGMGIFLYSILLYLYVIEWRQSVGPDDSLLLKAEFLYHSVINAGLPPLIIGIYFFGFSKDAGAFGLGLSFTLIFMLLHIVVATIIAHSELLINLLLQTVELLAAVGLILKWRNKELSA